MSTHWHPLVSGALDAVRRLENGWSLRSVAVEMRGGGHCVLSPTKKMGPGVLEPRFLVCSNHFHWLGIPEWSARFPAARIVASETAAPRLRAKLGKEIGTLAEVELPAGMRWLVPPGIGSGEAWLDIAGTWIVCDAFFNEPKIPTGLFGLGCRLTATTPGLRIGHTWKYMQLAKRAEYKEWLLERLATEPPAALVVAHGDNLREPNLGERLAALVRTRL